MNTTPTPSPIAQPAAGHTPGPWATEVLGHTLRVVQPNGTEFTDDIAVMGDCTSQRHQANARLIASAPETAQQLEELLAALQKIAQLSTTARGATYAVGVAKAAIARVEAQKRF